MNLHEKSYIELKEVFDATFKDWQANNLQIDRVKKKECIKYSDFVRSRADLRHLARENSRLHNILVCVDLEMQIRVWTGKND